MDCKGNVIPTIKDNVFIPGIKIDIITDTEYQR
jgi:hypothetical protein